jgi:hypothetical protein
MAVRNHTPRNPANTASVIAATVSTTKATRSPPGTGPESALTWAMIPSRTGPAARGSLVDGRPLLPRLAAAAGSAGGHDPHRLRGTTVALRPGRVREPR